MSVTSRPSAVSIALRYATGFTFGYLLTTAEVVATLAALCSETHGAASSLLNRANLLPLILVVAAGTVVTAVGSYRASYHSALWLAAGRIPDAGQRRRAMNILHRQTALVFTVWCFGGAIMITLNRQPVPATMIAVTTVFGALSTVSTGALFTHRVYRPLVAAATQDYLGRTTTPGVLARLVAMWVMNSAAPSLFIVVLIICRHMGWFMPTTASLGIPVVVVSVVSTVLGLRALMVVSLSISDPLRDVVEGMAEVERGVIGRKVPVYEQSEIGQLQSGFNRMVAGLLERDRLRDLFGRHVGPDVARLALSSDEPVAGEVCDVAVLFIDLAGSTQLAETMAPGEIAEVLNAFFQIVVAAVDEHGGLINKFQGDAALAIYGAPLRSDTAATDALATARTLCIALQQLPVVDFGIGVTAGSVFAGNIGAENRYEYTVIGDPVNEAARLADEAKNEDGRTLASEDAISLCDNDERLRWQNSGARLLRGRSSLTHTSIPISKNGPRD
ncbi:adenylate/guanylate cyclase domain-containing protein [Mycobacterium sp. CBMA293]|uniref:adenylate/guanylate cyclase domain-containing protein n=1 Tax=unclassified Mycolicibacterium TaxID=2636767 RepID=UPI0012DFD5CD|nr:MULTISPECIES: adenylate/guanylate cyclase domain-containing protein [unclassified Mycolicibacterium]MUL47016.1 adenylate/guanylate cyclase domain-containing protein [Mycolicibacterium sp. CBMA 360]MUL58392.1 adenylate/guanylate cyclase domain-containing protein [Mycolicibacterium sp. CBMA 335]MUL73850.1 adenylate/guanylate cyclase domain-containing protein [Mycolicibacterium sp. CBMA 311]MUL93275.1 adenylate/guanylate cyclase domain-containing protein [Mycolicibacterium sp. CBMA 230]MUM0782